MVGGWLVGGWVVGWLVGGWVGRWLSVAYRRERVEVECRMVLTPNHVVGAGVLIVVHMQ